MNNKAVISVVSRQSEDDESSIEVVTPGEFYKKEDKFCVVYDETEISGMQGTTTTFNIFPEAFSLIREGTTTTKMDFKENGKSLALYNTPYGVLELEIQTKKLEINMNENGGDIFIDYNMCISGQEAQKTQLKINIAKQA